MEEGEKRVFTATFAKYAKAERQEEGIFSGGLDAGETASPRLSGGGRNQFSILTPGSWMLLLLSYLRAQELVSFLWAILSFFSRSWI